MSQMNHKVLYDNVVASLGRVVELFREVEMPTADYVNWDAHASIGELPSNDLIGLAGVGFTEGESGHYEVVCGIAVSTWDDPNLARLTDLVSQVFGLFPPTTSVPVYDHSTGDVWSFMVVTTPRAVTPVGRAETRPVQAVEIRLLLDPGAGSSLQ
jgi:hypothetical protein